MAIFKILFFASSFPDFIQTQIFDPYFGFYGYNNSPMNLYTNPYNTLFPIDFGYSPSDWKPWTGGGFGRGSNSFNQINPFYYPFYNNNNNQFNSGIFGLSAIPPPPLPPHPPPNNNNNNPFGGILSALIGPPPPPPTLSPQNLLFQPNFGETTNGNNNFGSSSLLSPFGKKFRSRLGGGDSSTERQSLLSLPNSGNSGGCAGNKNGFLQFGDRDCNNIYLKNNNKQ